MYYRRRRRKKKYYEYHTDERLNRYFAPLVQDLKVLFFSLPNDKLDELFLDYGEKYGAKAEHYARYAYSKWQDGYIKMSEQTLLRLVETLPYFISEKQRFSLLDKLFNFHINKLPRQNVSIVTNWDNYNRDLNNLEYNILTQYSAYYKPVDFASEILDLATWLTADDVQLAKKILSDYYHKLFIMYSQNATKDIFRFRRLCQSLQNKDMVYDMQRLSLSLPIVNIELTLQPKKKSIFKAITSFFS